MICEGCIKQDVCKYKEEVERYEKKNKGKLPEPLEPTARCKYKRPEPHDWGMTIGSARSVHPWDSVTYAYD